MSDYGVYHKMDVIHYPTVVKVVVDSTFKLQNGECLIKLLQTDPLSARVLLINEQATSVRQLSEWGMRMIEGQFPRIKDSLRYKEEGERKIILRPMTLIYNSQTSLVGTN